jgi:hypothetical protein
MLAQKKEVFEVLLEAISQAMSAVAQSANLLNTFDVSGFFNYNISNSSLNHIDNMFQSAITNRTLAPRIAQLSQSMIAQMHKVVNLFL